MLECEICVFYFAWYNVCVNLISVAELIVNVFIGHCTSCLRPILFRSNTFIYLVMLSVPVCGDLR